MQGRVTNAFYYCTVATEWNNFKCLSGLLWHKSLPNFVFCVGKNFGGLNEIYSVFIWSNFPGGSTRMLSWPISAQRGGWNTSCVGWQSCFGAGLEDERTLPGFSSQSAPVGRGGTEPQASCYPEGCVTHKGTPPWGRPQQLCVLHWLKHERLKERGKPLSPLGWRKDWNFPLCYMSISFGQKEAAGDNLALHLQLLAF